MRVGLIFEGTYPYVTGGVSSWGNTLIKSMKDVEFCVIHIGATPEIRKPKYLFPENVVDYFEYFLFANYTIKYKRKITKDFGNKLKNILRYPFDEKSIAENLYDLFQKYNDYDFTSILKSKIYWDVMLNFYKAYIPYENFTNYFWTLQSMLLPFLNSMTVDLPKCDVYHTITTGYAGIVAVMNGIKNNKPVILTEHGIYHRERQLEVLKAGWIKDEYRIAWIKLFNTISALVYKGSKKITTLFLKNQFFEKELCNDTNKMCIIPNGVDYDKFSQLEYRKEKDPYIVGLVGRVVEIKDIKTAIKAAKMVKEKIPNFKLLIIGPIDEEPEYYNECLEMIKVFQLENTIEFTGKVNVLKYYTNINTLLLSSVSEGQPLVILEAFSVGIPVVATDVGSCSEMVYGTKEDIIGNAGIIVKPKDFVGLANGLIKLYEDDEFRINASRIAKIRVKKRYRLDQMIKNYKELYFSVVE
ncbi:Glycosyltransferase involved in cell wall bisynthesis [Marinitoga hydrogenitolerans DSM 16785]|uniref:Glycosyltransferase involved in cell wall bisynthesis n=1 Tax=Marinitoga hydrogenitolerans (strain DSM 16785 / JCM 12826 / AT1271) TaxID=1122195 RepID=A0A1M4S597_MARH1|nr:GT4 family glycosyltransferase PelF [Marinitoga hydrogenitolerans]SHE27384.1 Glycosyltransferase involved in cell wall bisynthesis [Marinitoga hydrogenitolerans DSM 16785]